MAGRSERGVCHFLAAPARHWISTGIAVWQVRDPYGKRFRSKTEGLENPYGIREVFTAKSKGT